jgi:hypothetical protein
MKFTKFSLCVLIAVSTVLLIGCGGGNDAAPAAGGSDPAGCTNLTYTANPTIAVPNLYTNASKVCFLASTTQLQFRGKTLTSPVPDAALTAPFTGYIFTDGSTASYEVIFNSGALFEINVSTPILQYGQFKP